MPNRIPTRAAACLLLAIAFALVPAGARAQPPTPSLTAPVNDLANVIDDASEREMDRRIRSLLAASGDVVVVATVQTYKPYGDIEEYAVKMFENGGRGIGAKGKDNGRLIVVAVEDRRVKIEVGYDLEQFVTDGFAGETIREAMTPQFRNGSYGAGLLAGTTRIINRLAEQRGVTLQDVPRDTTEPRSTGTGFPWWIIILSGSLILNSRRPRWRRTWGGRSLERVEQRHRTLRRWRRIRWRVRRLRRGRIRRGWRRGRWIRRLRRRPQRRRRRLRWLVVNCVGVGPHAHQ